MSTEPEPHVVLGVAPTATPQEVQRAFQRLVRAHHPDLAGEAAEGAERLRAILAAYAALRRAQAAGTHAAEAVPATSAVEPIVPSPPAKARTPRAPRTTPTTWPWREPAIRVGPVHWLRFPPR